MRRPLSRRLFLADLGKGGVAVLVLGLVACSDTGGGGDITSGGVSASTGQASPPTATSQGTSAPDTTPPSTTSTSSDLEWRQVSLGFVSAYVLARQGEAAVVDTGVAGSAPDIEAGLGEIGLGWDAVGHVILTHKHGDHVGSVTDVLELADAATGYAGADDIGSITAPRPLTPVGDGDHVFDLEIIATPGHTPGHVCVLDSTIGLLVAGDALSVQGGVVAGPNVSFTEDLTQAHESVRKLAGLQFGVLVVGHGDPIETNASQQVADLAAGL
ncbi:MAG TPA: MBL fold metallo-hydrolase [Acidimicrobiia bacterium]|jgi:glyoxylase-like metal-dependent hydrolase (beta-lactamase superfamily II)|nr:MBL fold metallo-hydrolase [Acidimicrobiia bacterium]